MSNQNISNQNISNKTSKQSKTQKAPLEGINPKQHTVEVIDTDGSIFKITTSWCFGQEGKKLHIDASPKNHPAWHEQSNQVVNNRDAQVSKFKKKFGDYDF